MCRADENRRASGANIQVHRFIFKTDPIILIKVVLKVFFPFWGVFSTPDEAEAF